MSQTITSSYFSVIQIPMIVGREPFYLSPLEPGIYAGALIVFLLAATVAMMLPALRLLRSNPIGALRHD